MPPNPQQQSQQPSKGEMLGLLMLLANGHATCVTVFTRSHFGVEALGVPGLTALGLMVVYGSLRTPGMLLYIACWLLALIFQRISTLRLMRRGWRAHSRYPGYPTLAMKVPGVAERVALMFVEPLWTVMAGATLYFTVSEGVGLFVMLSAASLLFRQGIEQEITRKRVQKMRDGDIEQRYLAERFRADSSEDC